MHLQSTTNLEHCTHAQQKRVLDLSPGPVSALSEPSSPAPCMVIQLQSSTDQTFPMFLLANLKPN